MTKERLKIIVEQVQSEIPLSLENETDGRYTWPRRWEELQKYIETEINLENKCTCEKCTGFAIESLY